MPALESHIYDVFRQYSRLYRTRNDGGGTLSPDQEKEWVEVTFTLESIFSGLYRPDRTTERSQDALAEFRSRVPVEFLRIPTDADVLCETQDNFFAGKLQDISLGGAYVQASVPFRLDSPLRLTFCTFDDHQPLEIDGRVAWANPAGARKSSLPEGAGVQFTHRQDAHRAQLEEYVYELVEDTLARANLI